MTSDQSNHTIWAEFGRILTATLGLVALASYLRSDDSDSPLELVEYVESLFSPYYLGLAVQELIVPLGLIAILSITPFFQRIVTQKKRQEWDQIKIFAVLAAIQALFFGFLWGIGDFVSLGVFIAAVGGLLGGWRVGLALGLMAGLWRGSADLVNEFLYHDEPWWVDENWFDIFWWFFVVNLAAWAPIWSGYVTGRVTTILQEQRYNPVTLLGLGSVLELFPFLLIIFAWNEAYRVELLLPAILITGLSLSAFGLIIRNVQGTVARQKADTAELALAQAELRALRAQINPHFLFNSLNTIRFLVRTDPNSARELLLRLSEVFQNALKSGDFITLGDEIHYTKAYIALEQARLEERLEVIWFVQSDRLLDTEVPTLILQPLVENAIVHGIAPQTEGGKLQITIRQSGSDLSLEIVDNGRGIPAERLATIQAEDDQLDDAIGLTNINSRLQALYGPEYTLHIESQENLGTTVQFKIPITT